MFLSTLPYRAAVAAFVLICVPTAMRAADRQRAPVNGAGAPVVDAQGKRINYSFESLAAMGHDVRATSGTPAAESAAPHGFVPTPAGAPRPFWQYAIFGAIGTSNIIIGPAPTGGGAREILIGGSSFWQAVRHNAATDNYDQIFVSPIYSTDFSDQIRRIALANVVGNSKKEIAVMLMNGRIYLYDFPTKTELGYFDTGISYLEGLSLTDLDGDGRAELIVTSQENLFVFDGAGALLWQKAGAGGYDVVVGQMDNDPALEIAATNGKVVDAGTRGVQWNRSSGFGFSVKLAPFPGESYQQLIAAEPWNYVYAYDIARKLPRWSIPTPQDFGGIQVADVENDGTPEVLIGDGQWGSVHVHNLITQAQKWEVPNPEHGITNIAVGDADSDGVVDLLWGAGWTSSGPDHFYVADTTGDRAIKWQSVDLDGPFLGPSIGDLDGDGEKELVICSFQSDSGYGSGRILVFDLATLALRGMSATVADNGAWTGVHDLKLRDLEGDGQMEIVLAADYYSDGIIEIYGFDSSNTFTRKWSNTSQPFGSPFNFVEVADLDGNGTREIIAGNRVEHTGSEGVYVYIYDYPSGTDPWRSVNLGSGFDAVSGLVVRDLDGNGSKEIAALIGSTSDLYTFNGLSRQLRKLTQNTGATLLSSLPSPRRLIMGDSTGVGHFLKYANNNYTEPLTRQLADTSLDGVNAFSDGALWTGSGGRLNLRRAPSYNSVEWESSVVGEGFGRFVATDVHNGENRVFSSAWHTVAGFTYALPEPPAVTAAVSRKDHGAAGAFSIALPITGTPGIECRRGGTDGIHTLVLTFNTAVTSGSAAVTAGAGGVEGEPTFSGNEMSITLTGVANAQRVTVTVTDVAGAEGPALASASITFGVLEGDVNGSQTVNASDIAQTKARLGQAVDAASFRSDVNNNSAINSSDVALVKARTGTALP